MMLNVQAHKMVVDSIGVETALPMNDWMEAGVFAPVEEGEKFGRPLYLKKHFIGSGQQTIMVMVPGKPSRAGVDPNSLFLDWEKCSYYTRTSTGQFYIFRTLFYIFIYN